MDELILINNLSLAPYAWLFLSLHPCSKFNPPPPQHLKQLSIPRTAIYNWLKNLKNILLRNLRNQINTVWNDSLFCLLTAEEEQIDFEIQ